MRWLFHSFIHVFIQVRLFRWKEARRILSVILLRSSFLTHPHCAMPEWIPPWSAFHTQSETIKQRENWQISQRELRRQCYVNTRFQCKFDYNSEFYFYFLVIDYFFPLFYSILSVFQWQLSQTDSLRRSFPIKYFKSPLEVSELFLFLFFFSSRSLSLR